MTCLLAYTFSWLCPPASQLVSRQVKKEVAVPTLAQLVDQSASQEATISICPVLCLSPSVAFYSSSFQEEALGNNQSAKKDEKKAEAATR